MANRINSRKILIGFLKKKALSYLSGVFFLVICSIVSGLVPMYLGKIIDTLKESSGNIDPIYKDIFLMFLFTLTVFILKYIMKGIFLLTTDP